MAHREKEYGISRYADMILTLWEQVKIYSTELKKDINEGRKNRDAMRNPSALAATLSEMWEELHPLVEGTELIHEYEEFKFDVYYPMALQNDFERMFELKRTLRKALHISGLTKIMHEE